MRKSKVPITSVLISDSSGSQCTEMEEMVRVEADWGLLDLHKGTRKRRRGQRARAVRVEKWSGGFPHSISASEMAIHEFLVKRAYTVYTPYSLQSLHYRPWNITPAPKIVGPLKWRKNKRKSVNELVER